MTRPNFTLTMQENHKKIRASIENSDNALVKLAGINVVEIEQNHVKLEMPLKNVNINHTGTAYAISMIMLMEITGTSLIRATYGFDQYLPIIKKIDISFIKPTNKTLICELKISEKEAKEKIAFIEDNNKGNYELPIILKDIENNEVAMANFVFYLFKQT